MYLRVGSVLVVGDGISSCQRVVARPRGVRCEERNAFTHAPGWGGSVGLRTSEMDSYPLKPHDEGSSSLVFRVVLRCLVSACVCVVIMFVLGLGCSGVGLSVRGRFLRVARVMSRRLVSAAISGQPVSAVGSMFL